MSNEHFTSQMIFLQTHAENYENRNNRLTVIDDRLKQLAPLMDEAKKLVEEKEELQKLNRDEKKFLISMNDMVLRNTGKPISEGPLFDLNNGNNSISEVRE